MRFKQGKKSQVSPKSSEPRKPLTDAQKAEIRRDFLAYSGGFTPNEAHDEVIRYSEAGRPGWLSQEDCDDFLEEWSKKLEGVS